MPRMSMKIKPYEVVSIARHSFGGSKSFHESFADEGTARKRAEKIAKEKNVMSVYLRTLDDEGDIVEQETIKKFTPIAPDA